MDGKTGADWGLPIQQKSMAGEPPAHSPEGPPLRAGQALQLRQAPPKEETRHDYGGPGSEHLADLTAVGQVWERGEGAASAL